MVCEGEEECWQVYMDGVFDLMHPGHFNAVRQARLLGKRLVVGVCSDEDVRAAKNLLPIYTASERAELLRGCKWVDEVVEGTPYTVSLEFLRSTGCDFVAHGDDIAIGADGQDCYSELRTVGLLKTFRRTEGISTTSLLHRLLEVADKHDSPDRFPPSQSQQSVTDVELMEAPESPKEQNGESKVRDEPQWIVSTKRLYEFIGKPRVLLERGRRVYIDGAFDMFHVGHLRVLQEARKLGDYLIVGVHNDAVVRRRKGRPFPVMQLLERAMNVMAMGVVDEVLVGAPWEINGFFIDANEIDVVVDGYAVDACAPGEETLSTDEFNSKLGTAQARDVLREINPPSLTMCDIIKRVRERKEHILETIPRRKEKERSFYIQKFSKEHPSRT